MNDVTGGSARRVVARYFRIWNDGDPSIVGELIGPNWIDHAHPDRLTVADIQIAIASARANRPNSRVLMDAMLGDGNLITVNGRIETKGDVQNRVWIVRVEDDRMREMWTYCAD
jgi:hypothetical protein